MGLGVGELGTQREFVLLLLLLVVLLLWLITMIERGSPKRDSPGAAGAAGEPDGVE